MIQSSVSLWLVPTTRAQAMSAPDDEVDGVRSCFHAGREPTSWFCIRRSKPRQPESWHTKHRAQLAGIWATDENNDARTRAHTQTSANIQHENIPYRTQSIE